MSKKYADLKISQIDRRETQVRVRTDSDLAAYYWGKILKSPKWPAPVVFHDGKTYWLADGFHTVRAYEQAGRAMVRCEIRKGAKQDALVYGLRANDDGRGLQLSLADRRHALQLLLADPKCSTWTNSYLAALTGYDEGAVRYQRKQLEKETPPVHGISEEPQSLESEIEQELVESLPPDQAAYYQSLPRDEQKQKLANAITDAKDNRLTISEQAAQRIYKRLGDDELGRWIRHKLKAILVQFAASIGWEEPARTDTSEEALQRTIKDIDTIKKAGRGINGQRQRECGLAEILDRYRKGA